MEDFSLPLFFVYLGRKVMLLARIIVWLKICFKTLKNAAKTPLSIQLPSKHTHFIQTRQTWWQIIDPHL